MIDPIQQFREAMSERGLVPPEDIIADGQIHRCDAEGKRGKHDGAYIFHPDGPVPAGGFQNWRDGLDWQNWRADVGRPLSEIEVESMRARLVDDQRRRSEKLEHDRERARKKAKYIWSKAERADEHGYLALKGVSSHGLRIYKDLLVVPFRSVDKNIQTLQFITSDGKKNFLTNGRKVGSYFSFGTTVPDAVILIAEGYATAATVFEATGLPTVMAGDSGNLMPVAEALHTSYPHALILICGDDDYLRDGNPGETKAIAAAEMVGGRTVFPAFGPNRPTDAVDFNDLARLHGIELVYEIITKTVSQASQPISSNSDQAGRNKHPQGPTTDWNSPQPFSSRMALKPYPVDSFPKGIQEVIAELAEHNKVPIPMIASSVLSVLSVSSQALVNVRRDARLVGPVSLFCLLVANSGERKTQIDSLLMEPIKEFDSQHRAIGKQLLANFHGEEEIWKAKVAGAKDSILKLSKQGKPTITEEKRHMDLVGQKPIQPKIPQLRREDTTPEGLARKLQTDWPSAGVISNEAGIILGSHGLAKDSITRSLSLFNKIWDGGEYISDRAEEERCRYVTGARVTLGLMVQDDTLRNFISRSMGLPRGTGFFSRFLFSNPESMMGTRWYSDPPVGSPALKAFHHRITEILNLPVAFGSTGVLDPVILDLSPAAKLRWVQFHDSIEANLSSTGLYGEVSDVASKAAENAVRVAALLHVFDNGVDGAIGESTLEGASKIAEWHLAEALRYLGGLSLPQQMTDAIRLEGWLVDHLNRSGEATVPHARILQYGPNSLREKAIILRAVKVLEELDRARFITVAAAKHVEVNPALLDQRERLPA